MNVLDTNFAQGFFRLADNGAKLGWHERNGGNLSYRMRREEAQVVSGCLHTDKPWQKIGATVPDLGGQCFMVTGSGKYLSNVLRDPEDTVCIIELDEAGENYRILWGLVNGGNPTSELPSHLMNHQVKCQVTEGRNRVIYHCHPANLIALTFVLPLEDKVFTRELWETMTECPVIFPSGIGVLPWMVPGGEEIALASCEKMKTYDVLVWAHHGLFCCGETFDHTFGLAHTVEKAAEILVKIRSMAPQRRQSITSDEFRALGEHFGIQLSEEFL